MVCFMEQDVSIGEKVVGRLKKLAQTFTGSDEHRWFVVTATVSIDGKYRGTCAMIQARTSRLAIERLQKATLHALSQPHAERSNDPVEDCLLLEQTGFMSFDDLPRALAFQVRYPQTGFIAYVYADCELSAAKIARMHSVELADGPCHVVFCS